jgi:O-methyltransferase
MDIEAVIQSITEGAFRLVRLIRRPKIPEGNLYLPNFRPWLGPGDFDSAYAAIRPFTIVSRARCFVLYSLARQAASTAEGEFWECGVYRGGTAMLLAGIMSSATRSVPLRLFDTFEGMPRTDTKLDHHREGDFGDVDLSDIRSRLSAAWTRFHVGLIPDTFAGLEDSRIAFAHIDVDIYSSVKSACEFIFPRMAPGGFLLFDDYGFPSCAGARKAIDEFFDERPEVPLVLSTGQALVFPAVKHRTP